MLLEQSNQCSTHVKTVNQHSVLNDQTPFITWLPEAPLESLIKSGPFWRQFQETRTVYLKRNINLHALSLFSPVHFQTKFSFVYIPGSSVDLSTADVQANHFSKSV